MNSELDAAALALLAGVQVKAKALAEVLAKGGRLPVLMRCRLLLDAANVEATLDGRLAELSAAARQAESGRTESDYPLQFQSGK